MRAFAQRALLVGVGLLIGLLLLEGLLRLAAAVLPQRLQRAQPAQQVERAPEPGEFRILCVGDSHTYGVGVAPDESYPSQLEAVLRARGIRARVVNAGVPGQNSSQLRERLPAKLAEYRPQIVIVWVGANNQWQPGGEQAAEATSVWSRMRLVRLARLLFTRTEGVTGDFRRDLDRAVAQYGGKPQEFGAGGKRPLRSVDATADVTREDLGPIIALVRQANAVPVLLTYPVPLGPTLIAINDAVLASGAANDTRVIDLHAMARQHMPRVPKLLQPDMHPKARFYRAIGWEIARTLVREGITKAPTGEAAPANAS